MPPRPAAVLVPLYSRDGTLWLVFTRRSADLEQHRGQISFPGGAVDTGDSSFLAAALREFKEELGVDPERVEVWKELKPVYIPVSRYLVHPFVGFLAARPYFRPHAPEVAEVLEVPLPVLLQPGAFRHRLRRLEAGPVLEPGFLYAGAWIWGATAVILDQFLAHLPPAP